MRLRETFVEKSPWWSCEHQLQPRPTHNLSAINNKGFGLPINYIEVSRSLDVGGRVDLRGRSESLAHAMVREVVTRIH